MKAEPKTLNDCKDFVLQNAGYKDYQSYAYGKTEEINPEHDDWDCHMRFMDEAANMYARIQIEKDRERCADIALAYTMTLLPERRKAMERVIIDWPINLD